MSVIVSTCQQISNSPLNHSTAKQIWSFPKSDRFKEHQSSICAQAFYNLPDIKDKRKAGIGYGSKQKYDLAQGKSLAPAPSAYNLKSDIEISLSKKKGYPFGLSREAMSITGITGNLNQWSPAPGKYNLGSTLSNLRYTMRPKLENQFNLGKSNVPGIREPIHSLNYQAPELIRYYLQLMKKASIHFLNFIIPVHLQQIQLNLQDLGNCVTFKKKKKKILAQSLTPGPGAYKHEQTGMSKDGRYFVSKLENSKCRSFPHEMRRTGSVSASGKQNMEKISLVKVPGPGSYRLPSEFGYYEAKIKNN